MSVAANNNNESTRLTQEAILQQKQDLNKFLNRAMSELYDRFGSSEDPKIQQMVQNKLNQLKIMVGQVEKNAKTEHMKVDMICDQKQKEILDEEKKLHEKIRKDQKELQDDCTRQFKEWAQQQQHNSPQHTLQSITDSIGNLKW